MTEDIKIRVADKEFIGPEFLTWLYFVSLDDRGVSCDLNTLNKSGLETNMVVGSRINLKVTETMSSVALKGGGLDDSGELLQAVRRGAHIDALGLCVALGERVYTFVLAADGTMSSVKLPDLFSDDDGEKAGEVGGDGQAVKKRRRPKLPLEDIMELRMQCLDELDAICDALFAEFLTRRLSSDAWARDERTILRCVSEGLSQRLVVET